MVNSPSTRAPVSSTEFRMACRMFGAMTRNITVGQLAPRLLQPGDVDRRLQSLLSLEISPELAAVLKAAGAAVLLVAALLIVARAASRWRLSSADADATEEQRDSVWEAGRLRRILLAWLRRLFAKKAA